MALLPVVNQKRLYSQLLLEEAKKAEGQPHLQRGLLEGALLHLNQARLFYLEEVAESYQCPQPAVARTATLLAEQLAGINKYPAEASELVALSEDKSSWYAQLGRCAQYLGLSPKQPKPAGAGLINVFDVDAEDGPAELTFATLEAWLQAFIEMVERQRQVMVEC